MSKTYYFRKDRLGFIDWAKSLPECRIIIKGYRSLSLEMKIHRLAQYKSAKKVCYQYNILMHSLTAEQKKYWHKRFVKWETPSWNDKGSFYIEDMIYQNWIEIIKNNQEEFEFPSTKTIGLKLKEIRIRSGYSIRQVAEILGINEKTIQRYENGQYYPRIDILFGFGIIYGFRIEYLLCKILKNEKND